ncbi:MAG: hypothetical protein O7J95_02965, partial [Planctomycetota bacterium]|nr:hypothetical protein [Planctomycetota bacterium]
MIVLLDFGGLVQQIGLGLIETAREQAKGDLAKGENLVRQLQALRDETLERPSLVNGETSEVDPNIEPDAFAHSVIGATWNA